ncbi:hydrogenase maturation nickel metallochaperone HypA [Streptomyces sp. NPDC003077]|uniref:hydrogenase maturation nickel metallochaperone HypA/HybF n=1 Tax=Streptomyces sp. NPDC003077 TaxID=3154443 RepID=UPI0033A704FE
MHEVGLCEGILRAVEDRAAGRRVTGLTLRIGELHAVVEPALAQSFELVAAGSVAEGAEVELRTVPGDELTLVSIRVAREAGAVAPDTGLVAPDADAIARDEGAGGDRVPRDSR